MSMMESFRLEYVPFFDLTSSEILSCPLKSKSLSRGSIIQLPLFEQKSLVSSPLPFCLREREANINTKAITIAEITKGNMEPRKKLDQLNEEYTKK